MKYVLTDAAVRKLRGVLAPRSGNTGAGGAATPVSPDDFPPPYTVRWSQSENSGEGAWVIWLPDPERLVYYDEEWRTIGQIAAAQTLPSGWYTITGVRDQDRTVYLYVRDTRREGSTGGIVEAGLSRTDSQGSSGGDYFFCGKVAVMEVDSATGARRVKQFINSTVEIAKNGTGGGSVTPDDVSTEFIPDPPSGTQPDGDEGELQIKGFKAGEPADTNTIAEYLMGTAQFTGQVWLIVRGKSTGGNPALGYLPLAALNLYEYAKKTDLPTVNDGTLTIKQGTTTLGTFTANQSTGTTVTIPEPPAPPTVNNGTLTLNLGSLTKTFTANQATNETVTVPAKTIAAGSNVAISVNGNTITISANGGGATSGFSGTRRTLALTRYDISTNQLQAKFFTETWANGLMTASVIDDAWSVIEGGQAVVETV